MLVHHLATIMLITFSYANNMIRAGTLVMCLHDASDVFLEVQKLRMFFFFLFLVTPAPLDWRGFNSANIVMLSITGTCTTCPTEEEQKKAHTSYQQLKKVISIRCQDTKSGCEQYWCDGFLLFLLLCSQRLPNWLIMPSTRSSAMACLCCSA